MVIHLYAGKNEGYDLTRALKEAGGDTTRLLEVDILRNQSHDMSKDDAMYAALLRIAMLGWVDAVIGGPNCRTRSELRHHPVAGLPGPSRSLGRPWGLDELDEVERAKCHLDDVLLLRMHGDVICDGQNGSRCATVPREELKFAADGQVPDGAACSAAAYAGSGILLEDGRVEDHEGAPQLGSGDLQPRCLWGNGGETYFTGTEHGVHGS